MGVVSGPVMLAEVVRRDSRKAEQSVSENGRYRARARDDRPHSPLSRDAQYIWREQNQTGTCPKKGSSTLFLCDDHMWWSSRQRLYSEKEKKNMAKTYQAPLFVRLGNVLTTTLLRA